MSRCGETKTAAEYCCLCTVLWWEGLPEVLHPLGSLVQQETFSVLVENRNQPSNIFKNRRQSRQVIF